MTLLGKAFRGLGAAAGGALGGYIGHPVAGAAAGNSLGATLSKWLGSGDYTVSANTLVQRSQNGSPAIPMMHNGGQTITVRHKEYLGEILSSISFTVRHIYDLNPGIAYTFPWLSGIAQSFQEYKIKGMVFHYVPTSGSAINGTNAALGSVMMHTSYRATEASPRSKVEMLNEYWAAEAAPNESFCHPIECNPNENPFNVQYVRSGALPASENQLMYDLGRTFVAVSGNPANGNVLGDLWVTYDVELKKPIVSSSVADDIYGCTISSVAGFTPAAGNWFQNGSLSGARVGPMLATLSVNSLVIPKGSVGEWYVLVRIAATGNFTAMDLSGAPAITPGTAVARNPFPSSTISAVYHRTVLSIGAGQLNNGYYLTAVAITDPQTETVITFPAGSWTGVATSYDVLVSKAFLNV
jgi:hypothetical protein